MIREQRVDMLGVGGLQRRDAHQSTIREVHVVDEPTAVDHFVEREVLRRIGVQTRGVHEPRQVHWVVVQIPRRDQPPAAAVSRDGHVDRPPPAACVEVGVAAQFKHTPHLRRVAQTQFVVSRDGRW